VIEPLKLTFEVNCPAPHAFDVWTAQISRWWPSDHTVSAEDGLTVVLERKLGGRIYEQTSTGTQFEWGEVTVWEPPRRLVYLWHLRRDRADATEVEITFVEQSDSSTRVEIEHRGWERLGAAGQGWRDANQAGWSTLLGHYIAACSE
jgi:uncharacterized protein YndB with AHSA1/START domain